MPTYDYRCAKCGETIEVWQSFSDSPLTKHEDCGGKLTKVLAPAGFAFKGSGFYKNDAGSRAAGRKHDAKAASSESSGGNGAAGNGAAGNGAKSGASGGDGKPSPASSSSGAS